MTYRNTAWKRRDYECTNVVAARATQPPPRGQWVPAEDSALDGLTRLWIEAGIEYWGYM